jgi:hypothetical protein
MCIIVKKEFVTKEPMKAYKRVDRMMTRDYKLIKNTYRSPIDSITRMRQSGYKTTGRKLRYVIGKTTRSPMPKTAGIYLYRRIPRHASALNIYIVVEIPTRTKVRIGDGGKLCASRVKVLREVKRRPKCPYAS